MMSTGRLNTEMALTDGLMTTKPRSLADLCGQLQIIGPNNGPNEGLQACLLTAEEGLVVALILTVLL